MTGVQLDGATRDWLSQRRPPEARVIMAIIDALVDIAGAVSPDALVGACDEIELLGLRSNAELAAEWFDAVAALAKVAARKGDITNGQS